VLFICLKGKRQLLAKLPFIRNTRVGRKIFCELKDEWHKTIFPVLMCLVHAKSEMFMQPFIWVKLEKKKVLLISN